MPQSFGPGTWEDFAEVVSRWQFRGLAESLEEPNEDRSDYKINEGTNESKYVLDFGRTDYMGVTLSTTVPLTIVSWVCIYRGQNAEEARLLTLEDSKIPRTRATSSRRLIREFSKRTCRQDPEENDWA